MAKTTLMVIFITLNGCLTSPVDVTGLLQVASTARTSADVKVDIDALWRGIGGPTVTLKKGDRGLWVGNGAGSSGAHFWVTLSCKPEPKMYMQFKDGNTMSAQLPDEGSTARES